MSCEKILIFSFEPISNVMSNGRTLRNVLLNFEKRNIYNVYIHGIADLDGVNYYRISDKEALKSFFGIRPKITFSNTTSSKENANSQPRQKKRSNLKMLIRELVWSSKKIRKALLDLSRQINPDVVLVFLGNGAFIMKNTVLVSKSIKKPIFTFNCEDYYFKNYDYITYKKRCSILHKIYKRNFVNSYNLLMDKTSASFYLTDELSDLFKTVFPNQNSCVLYTSSEIVPDRKQMISNSSKEFIYAGNVGIGRLEELIKVGKIIKSINAEYKLVVYCFETRKKLLRILQNTDAFEYRGFEKYGEIIKKMSDSYAVIHVESSNPFYAAHTVHGFSTKIADCLSIGNCFIAKVSNNSTVYHYLLNNCCAFVCSSDDEMKLVLDNIINKKDDKQKYVNNALLIAKTNHSATLNSQKFQHKIIETINNK